MSKGADVIVVGLGALGSAAAYQAARRGARVVGIDRFDPPHPHGSTHGESRITREAIGEGEAYVPFARRSHALWREIEAETGETLFHACGCLVVESAGIAARHPGKDRFFDRTVEIARTFGVPHELLDAGEVMARYPAFQLAGDERGYLEPGAGMVDPEACVAAQLRLARRHGAAIHTGETVLGLFSDGDGVRVETDRATYAGATAILAAGAWSPGLAHGLDAAGPLAAFSIHRQAMFWFAADDIAAFRPGAFPVFIWMHGEAAEDWFYGFPALPGRDEVKFASETFATARSAPGACAEAIEPGEGDRLFATHLAGRIAGLRPDARRAATCLYTTAPDHRFMIDRQPGHERVILVSACSGHGFKHSAALGESVAELALENRSRLDLTSFGLGRLAPPDQAGAGNSRRPTGLRA